MAASQTAPPAKRADRSNKPKSSQSAPTKQLRSAETRLKLLNATIDCIEEMGYRETTVARVTSKAGVSVGAYMHHFPTKDQLMADALDHLYEQHMLRFERQVGNIVVSDPQQIEMLLDGLRRIAFSEVFAVANEYLVAQRTDAPLRNHARSLSLKHRLRMRQVYERVFGTDVVQNSRILDVLDGAFSFLLRGLSVVAVGRTVNEIDDAWRLWKGHIVQIIMDELASAERKDGAVG